MEKSKGLGDTIHKITRITGVQKVVTLINKGECTPCEERRKKMNEAFPYDSKKENK